MGNGPLWLVGMMGAGKSAVGPRLAVRLGRRFVDSDSEIERRADATVAEIFESEGEEGFRARERSAVASLRHGADVVALGGGAAAQPGAADCLAATGTMIYLRARPATLLARIGRVESRPLLRDVAPDQREATLAALLERRRSAYERAAIAVDTDGLTVQGVVDRIVAQLEAAA